MSFTMNLNRRHKRLAKRIRCGFNWPSDDPYDPSHEHSCKVFKGHASPYHVCSCDAVSKKTRPQTG